MARSQPSDKSNMRILHQRAQLGKKSSSKHNSVEHWLENTGRWSSNEDDISSSIAESHVRRILGFLE
jgi:hypothetical protein